MTTDRATDKSTVSVVLPLLDCEDTVLTLVEGRVAWSDPAVTPQSRRPVTSR